MSVCVNHLKRCKTSNLLEFRSSVPVLSLDFIFCFSDLQESPLNEDTPSLLWYAIWTQIARTCTRYSNPPSLEPASRFHRFCFNQFYIFNYGWYELAQLSCYGDGKFSMFFRSPQRPIPVRCTWTVCARKMHSTTTFATTVLSKCVTHVGSTRCPEPFGEYLSR